ALHDRMGAIVGALEDACETRAQAPAATEDLEQVAVEEAVFPDALEHLVQLSPDVIEPRQAAVGRSKHFVHARFVAREQLLDDVVLVAEVVVQVAGTDLQLVGDMVGGDGRFAAGVEHRQGAIEDAPSGVAGHRVAQPFRLATRSMYSSWARSRGVPLSLLQASNLAVPTKSKNPGLSPVMSPAEPCL